jgi:hypothetical protein
MNAVWREARDIKRSEAETVADRHISDVRLNFRQAVGIGELFQTQAEPPCPDLTMVGTFSRTILDDCRWEKFGTRPLMSD